ncbi:MAG: hypothetical protein J1E99_03435 [Muribaculaceae bacterium]|nr:hypothetical protein [Muribaculaceae bacterium]
MIMFYGIAMTLLSYTLVNKWLVVAFSLPLALMSAFPVWYFRRERSTPRRLIITLLLYIVGATGFFMTTILAVNYFGRDKEDSMTVEAPVKGIYSETRQRSRRVNRRYVASGETYKVHYMVILLPDSSEMKYPLSTEEYNKYAATSHIPSRRPKSVELTLSRGFLGWPVVTK